MGRQPPGATGSVDVEALVAEIKAEVARKAEEGLYPPELLIELVAATDRSSSPSRDGQNGSVP